MLAPSVPLTATLAPAPGGVAGIYNSARLMRDYVRTSKSDPVILSAASSIIFLTPERDQWSEVEALFNFVRDTIRYQRDVAGIETLTIPRVTLVREVGDCDDQVTLLCSLLESVGYPTRFVIAGYSGAEFEHVYCQVFANGEWVNCDPTEFRGALYSLGYAPPAPTIIEIERV